METDGANSGSDDDDMWSRWPDRRDYQFTSQIKGAIFDDHLELFKRNFAEPSTVLDDNGNTALHLAALCGSKNICEFLLRDATTDLNVCNSKCNTPLMLAIRNAAPEQALQLIEAGCDIHAADKLSRTALHLSVCHLEFKDVTHKLIQYGADLDVTDNFNYTPLHWAVERINEEAVCMLLYYGADADVQCTKGRTAFMLALSSGHDCNCEHLINYQIDYNAYDTSGHSVLHMAVLQQSRFVEDILRRGANVVQEKISDILISLMWQSNITSFKLLWKHNKDKLDVTTVAKLLFLLLDHDTIKPTHWLHLLDLIFEYHRIFDVFLFHPECNQGGIICQYRSNPHIISHLIIRMKSAKVTVVDIRIKLLYLFLSCGADVYLSDITTTFKYFGFNEELNVLLTFDHIHDHLALVEDVDSPIILLILSPGEFIKPELFFNRRFKHPCELYKFCTDPYGIHQDFLRNHSQFKLPKVEVRKCSTFPSLIELSRNAFRLHLATSTNSLNDYFKALRNLDCPQLIKDIISFKRPLYNIIVVPVNQSDNHAITML